MIPAVVASTEAPALEITDRSRAKNSTGAGSSATPSVEKSSDLPNLDLLRSTAVLLVLFGHLAAFMKIRGLGDVGYFGVLLFFVHTALVLMLSMERLGLSGSKLYFVFVVRRFFRIYPLSVLAVLVAVGFSIPSAPWLGGFVWPGWQGLVSNILLIQNITHNGSVISVLWSLPFEVQMYAFLPLFFLVILRFPSLWTISLIWVSSVVIAGSEYLVRIGLGDSQFLVLRYFPCFLAGVFAWRLMAHQHRRLPNMLWGLFLLALVVLYRLEDVFRVYGPNWLEALHGKLRNDHQTWMPPSLDLVRDWALCAITGFAIPFFAQITNRLLNSITRRIAMYSYGIYICHIPVLWLCFDKLHLVNSATSAIVAVFTTALVSIALYHFLEHPAIQFGKHLTAQPVTIAANA